MEHSCYVTTDAHLAQGRVPSIVAELHKAHLARLQRFKVAAVGRKAIEAAKAVDDEQVAILETWEDRQKQIPIPKPRWFSVEKELGPVNPVAPTIDQIQRAVCAEFNMSRSELIAQRRTAATVMARQVAMYLCKTLTVRSTPEIGRHFSNRDHTTVLHSIKKIENLIARDQMFASQIETLKACVLA